jgi:hypothetical protein
MKKIEELIAEIETKHACVSLHSIGEGCCKTAFISYINRRNAGRNNFFTLELPMDIQAWWDTVFRGTLFCDIEFGQCVQLMSERTGLRLRTAFPNFWNNISIALETSFGKPRNQSNHKNDL